MGRVSRGPRYFASKRGWFAEINGVRQRLTTGPKSSTRETAERMYEQLSAVTRLALQGDTATVHAVLNDYLLNATTRLSPPPLAPSTLKMHRETIEDLCVFPINGDQPLGLMRVRDLRIEHIQAWIASRKSRGRMHKVTKKRIKWSDNYAHMQLRILRTAFKWAQHEAALISKSPFSRKLGVRRAEAEEAGHHHGGARTHPGPGPPKEAGQLRSPASAHVPHRRPACGAVPGLR
jgi:hypothetical protein